MKPEYIEELADIADPDKLWQLAGLEQQKLGEFERKRLDTGIALRRYASHIRDLRTVLVEGRSLLITPLTENSTHVEGVVTPAKQRRLRVRSKR